MDNCYIWNVAHMLDTDKIRSFHIYSDKGLSLHRFFPGAQEYPYNQSLSDVLDSLMTPEQYTITGRGEFVKRNKVTGMLLSTSELEEPFLEMHPYNDNSQMSAVRFNGIIKIHDRTMIPNMGLLNSYCKTNNIKIEYSNGEL